ncbi:hypothetical protein ACJJTC_014039 [Scirpophaga incertulas]
MSLLCTHCRPSSCGTTTSPPWTRRARWCSRAAPRATRPHAALLTVVGKHEVRHEPTVYTLSAELLWHHYEPTLDTEGAVVLPRRSARHPPHAALLTVVGKHEVRHEPTVYTLSAELLWHHYEPTLDTEGAVVLPRRSARHPPHAALLTVVGKHEVRHEPTVYTLSAELLWHHYEPTLDTEGAVVLPRRSARHPPHAALLTVVGKHEVRHEPTVYTLSAELLWHHYEPTLDTEGAVVLPRRSARHPPHAALLTVVGKHEVRHEPTVYTLWAELLWHHYEPTLDTEGAVVLPRRSARHPPHAALLTVVGKHEVRHEPTVYTLSAELLWHHYEPTLDTEGAVVLPRRSARHPPHAALLTVVGKHEVRHEPTVYTLSAELLWHHYEPTLDTEGAVVLPRRSARHPPHAALLTVVGKHEVRHEPTVYTLWGELLWHHYEPTLDTEGAVVLPRRSARHPPHAALLTVVGKHEVRHEPTVYTLSAELLWHHYEPTLDTEGAVVLPRRSARHPPHAALLTVVGKHEVRHEPTVYTLSAELLWHHYEPTLDTEGAHEVRHEPTVYTLWAELLWHHYEPTLDTEGAVVLPRRSARHPPHAALLTVVGKHEVRHEPTVYTLSAELLWHHYEPTLDTEGAVVLPRRSARHPPHAALLTVVGKHEVRHEPTVYTLSAELLWHHYEPTLDTEGAVVLPRRSARHPPHAALLTVVGKHEVRHEPTVYTLSAELLWHHYEPTLDTEGAVVLPRRSARHPPHAALLTVVGKHEVRHEPTVYTLSAELLWHHYEPTLDTEGAVVLPRRSARHPPHAALLTVVGKHEVRHEPTVYTLSAELLWHHYEPTPGHGGRGGAPAPLRAPPAPRRAPHCGRQARGQT